MKRIILIIGGLLVASLLTSTIVLGYNLNKEIEKNKSLNASNIRISKELADSKIQIEEKIKIIADSQKSLDISNAAGQVLIKLTTEMEDLYMRYDNVFVSSYNYCIDNVEWNYIGQYDMANFLKEQKQIQKDYNTMLNKLNSLIN